MKKRDLLANFEKSIARKPADFVTRFFKEEKIFSILSSAISSPSHFTGAFRTEAKFLELLYLDTHQWFRSQTSPAWNLCHQGTLRLRQNSYVSNLCSTLNRCAHRPINRVLAIAYWSWFQNMPIQISKSVVCGPVISEFSHPYAANCKGVFRARHIAMSMWSSFSALCSIECRNFFGATFGETKHNMRIHQRTSIVKHEVYDHIPVKQSVLYRRCDFAYAMPDNSSFLSTIEGYSPTLRLEQSSQYSGGLIRTGDCLLLLRLKY